MQGSGQEQGDNNCQSQDEQCSSRQAIWSVLSSILYSAFCVSEECAIIVFILR